MLNWEYTNFNELIPFCDPNTDDEQPSSLVPEQYNLFPGLGLVQQDHQVKYSFLQWASCFVTYMAVMASKSNDTIHMYVCILQHHPESTS